MWEAKLNWWRGWSHSTVTQSRWWLGWSKIESIRPNADQILLLYKSDDGLAGAGKTGRWKGAWWGGHLCCLSGGNTCLAWQTPAFLVVYQVVDTWLLGGLLPGRHLATRFSARWGLPPKEPPGYFYCSVPQGDNTRTELRRARWAFLNQ